MHHYVGVTMLLYFFVHGKLDVWHKPDVLQITTLKTLGIRN